MNETLLIEDVETTETDDFGPNVGQDDVVTSSPDHNDLCNF